jgi:hypothetical protein
MNIIPTISNDLISDLLDNYLLSDLAVFLIYYPELGFDNTPTKEELDLRKSLDMESASLREVILDANNYKRYLVSSFDIEQVSSFTRVIKARFIAQGGAIGPFTHAVLARQVDVLNATFENGNNRGSDIGIVVSSSPLPVHTLDNGDLGAILEDNQELEISMPLNLVSRSFSYANR